MFLKDVFIIYYKTRHNNFNMMNSRREVLKAINADLAEELKYSREMIEEHPKNYQV